MIVKAFKLQVKMPTIDFDRWKDNCIQAKRKKIKNCGCF